MPTFDDATIPNLSINTLTVGSALFLNNGIRAPRRYVQAPDMDVSFVGKDYDIVIIPSTITLINIYTIDDTGAVDGDQISFVTQSSGFTSSINGPGPTFITLIQNTSGVVFRVDVMRIGGTWTMIGLYVVP